MYATLLSIFFSVSKDGNAVPMRREMPQLIRLRESLRERKAAVDLIARIIWRERSPSRLGWKPIPSEARVTRDEVSGLKKTYKQLSGRQYHSRI